MGHTAPVLRLAATHGVVAFVRGVPADLLRRRAEALRLIYTRAVGRELAAEVQPLAGGGPSIVVIGPSAAGVPAGSGTWGVLYDDSGALSPADAERWARQPARAVRGVGLAWSSVDGTLRIATTAAAPHTLWRHTTGAADVLSTKGLAAVVLAGSRPQPRREVLAELVVFDYVLGVDGGLQDVSALPEATAVAVDRAGTQVSSWWSREERWSPGPESTPEQVAEALQDAVRGLADVPGTRLGLTAGRDSAVVGGALVRVGAAPPAFTLGGEGPEVAGARATAARLGLAYEAVPVSNDPPRADWADVERIAPWLEGLETPRPVAAGQLVWDETDVMWATGHGGEIGRSFYWNDPTESVDAAIVRLCDRAGPLTPPTRRLLEDRLGLRLAAAEELRPDIADRLDLFYALDRMHKWINRGWPFPQVTGMTVPMLEPPVARLLADLPVTSRAERSGFAQVVALLAPGTPSPVRVVQPAAVVPHMNPLRRGLRRARAEARRLGGRRPPGPPADTGEPRGDGPVLLRLLAAQPSAATVARESMGDAWWEATTSRLPTSAWHQKLMWNVLGWVAWERSLADMRSTPPSG